MKIELNEIFFLAIFSLLTVIVVHLNRIPAVRIRQDQLLARDRTNCRELAQRVASVAWDEERGWCVLAEKSIKTDD